MDKIIIIGSGLTGITAAKELVKQNIKPIILDIGNKIASERQCTADLYSKISPKEWNIKDRLSLMSNYTLDGSNNGLRKLEFGSDYFYNLDSDINYLPSSEAMGGFAQGWGSSSLIADNCDMMDWPINREDLMEHYKSILDDVPYSAVDDDLSEHFPAFGNSSLKLTSAHSSILAFLRKKKTFLRKNGAVAGQSRLMVNSMSNDDKDGCRYCGLCMSGCVYNSIYKSSNDLLSLIRNNCVDYISGARVLKFKESVDGVKVYIQHTNGECETIVGDKVFLAAGAVNSTKIVAASFVKDRDSVTMLGAKGFVVPMLSIKRHKFEWPSINTFPGIFLEYKDKRISNHWFHTQINAANELLLMKLGVINKKTGKINKLKKRIAEHLVVAAVNMHSDHAPKFKMEFCLQGDDLSVNVKKLTCLKQQKKIIGKVSRKLFSIMKSIGVFPILPMITSDIQGYHIGGSLPMSTNPTSWRQTDVLGRPFSLKRVHVIDSSIFPSIPGTTVGLLAMANARRIVIESLLQN